MRNSMGFQKRLFAALVLLCCSTAGLRAQTNAEYNFTVDTLADGTSYGIRVTTLNNDPCPILSMSCLAANGYGQWTLSSTWGSHSSFPPGWFLLENALREPSLSYSNNPAFLEPGCIPPGVVQNGALVGSTFPAEPKATANLDSWINYTWPDTTDRTKFDFQYFSSADIDLSGKFCTNPTIGKMNIITASSIHSGSVATDDTFIHPHNIDTESDYRDEFDHTSDAHFRYYVWASNVNPVHTGVKAIWAMAVPLGSSTPTVKPFYVGDGKFPTVACDARNNRRSPDTAKFDVAYINPSGQPVDISYKNNTPTPFLLTGLFIPPYGYNDCDPPPGHPPCPLPTITSATHVRAVVSEIAGQTTVIHGMYVIGYSNPVNTANETWPNPLTTEGLFLYPALSATDSTSANLCDGPPLPGSDPTKIASVVGVVDEPITAFCDPYDNQNKPGYEGFHVVYRINALDPTDTAREPLMIMKAWYNGSTWPSPTPEDSRLMLNQPSAGGGGIGTVWPPPTNRGYVAAVNQMGIHVHWRSGTLGSGTHYYARDMNRTFDEPIEEHTIVTDLCNVTDGSISGTNHGGTVGTELLPGKKMLVWTDPNFGAGLIGTDSGLYQPADPSLWWQGTALTYPPVGTLQLLGTPISDTLLTSVKLSIGDPDSTNQGATLTVMPNFYFLFPGWTYAPAQSVVINGGDTLNYYGIWGRRSSYTIPVLGGVPQNWTYLSFGATQITSSLYPAEQRSGMGLIDLEGTSSAHLATLIVHGGADFHIGEDAYFTSNFGNIQVKNEDNIFPLLASGHTNPLTTGIATFEGQATIDSSHITGYTGAYNLLIPQRSYYVFIHVPGSYDGGDNGVPDYDGGITEEGPGTVFARPNGAYKSTNNIYTDLDSNGAADNLAVGVISFDQKPLTDTNGAKEGGEIGRTGTYYPPYPYMDVSFSNDSLNNVEITAIDPQHIDANPNISITNSAFKGLPVQSIDIEHTDFSLNYPWWGNIAVSGNTFYGYSISGEQPFGNFIYGLDLQSSMDNTDSLFKLNVESNVFSSAFRGTVADIDFTSSDGIISSNTIHGYTGAGINISGIFHSGYYNLTFIGCQNVITGPIAGGYTSYGIQSSNYQGYIKLDSINGVEYGWYNSVAGGPPHIVGTQILDCSSNGILAGAIVDLSGVHHNDSIPESGDIPGYNQIHDNAGAQIAMADSSTISHPINVWVTQNDHIPRSAWTEAGQNNIYQGSGSPYLIQGISFSNTSIVIDSNYWGSGITPPGSSPSSTHWPNFNFTAPFGAISFTSIPSELTCSSDLDMVKKSNGIKPLSTLDADSCGEALNAAYNWDQNTTNPGAAYDTMKWYITHCYKNASDETWDIFGDSFDSVGQTAAGRQDVFNFILYALSLRNDNDWFCAAVPYLAIEYDYGFQGQTPNYRADRAIYLYLMNNPRCAGNYTNDSEEYYSLLATQRQIWSDTSAPGSTMDSSVPTLHDLGLDTLLKINAQAGVTFALPTAAIINSASIVGNPFQNSTSVFLSIEREAYVTFQVFNILGEQVPGAGYAGTFEQGNATVPINMSNAPPGAYYLRISTANNETQTLKLTKK